VSPQILLYNLLLVVAAPLLLLQKLVRYWRRREDYEIAPDRFFSPKIPAKSKKKRVVFVALSWGETAMLDRLSRDLEASSQVGDQIEIVWAIREKAAREMAKTRFPNRVLVPMPFDFAPAVFNWQRTVKADVLIIVEKFWWPNLLWLSKLNGAKVLLINGRSRGRNSLRYKLLSGYQRFVLGAFDLLMFGDEGQVGRIRDVLPATANVIATGNIKFAFDSLTPPQEAASLEQWIIGNGEKPVLMAGSTHEIDEDWLLNSFPFERATLLLAPRNLKRVDEVATRFRGKGLTVSRRSEAPDVNSTDVLLLDSMGELAYAYKWAKGAYVGGAVLGRGHNIIEPLIHGIPVAYGPNRGDFEGAQQAAEEFGVGVRLHNAEQLADFWNNVLERPTDDATFEEKCEALLDANRKALEVTIRQLEQQIL
jgi:3-deoxy-D-manno-octulosonic-acid transferase